MLDETKILYPWVEEAMEETGESVWGEGPRLMLPHLRRLSLGCHPPNPDRGPQSRLSEDEPAVKVHKETGTACVLCVFHHPISLSGAASLF